MASRQDQATAFLEGGNEDREVPEVGANAVPPTITGAERERDWDPNAMKPFGPKPIPDHRWFESKPLIGRLFILIAGVTMNVILALVIDVGSFSHYGRLYTPRRCRHRPRRASGGAGRTSARRQYRGD